MRHTRISWMVGRYKLAAPVSKIGPDSNPGREHYSHHPPFHSQVMTKQHGRLLTGSSCCESRPESQSGGGRDGRARIRVAGSMSAHRLNVPVAQLPERSSPKRQVVSGILTRNANFAKIAQRCARGHRRNPDPWHHLLRVW